MISPQLKMPKLCCHIHLWSLISLPIKFVISARSEVLFFVHAHFWSTEVFCWLHLDNFKVTKKWDFGSKSSNWPFCWESSEKSFQFLHLVPLEQLKSLSVMGNECVSAHRITYDYRPYLVCCCVGLQEIDGFAVSDFEQMKGWQKFLCLKLVFLVNFN